MHIINLKLITVIRAQIQHGRDLEGGGLTSDVADKGGREDSV